MTVELCKDSECVFTAQGIIQIILITLGYLKYFLVIMLILFYCCYFRRNVILNENFSQNRKSETIINNILKIYHTLSSFSCGIAK